MRLCFARGRSNSLHCWAKNVGSCCVRVGNGVQADATTPNNMQQGVQTDATCNIQQYWELLATMLRPFARGFKLDNVARLVTLRSPEARFACSRVNDTLLHRITYKVWISTVAKFFTSTHVNFTRVNNIDRHCMKFRTKKQLLRFRATFHTFPLFYLRTQSLRAHASKITRL